MHHTKSRVDIFRSLSSASDFNDRSSRRTISFLVLPVSLGEEILGTMASKSSLI